jgi:hypothetical protein
MDAMPERASQWLKRVEGGEGQSVSLDWGMELWKWDVSLYESADGIRAALLRAGRAPDDDSILADATGSLLTDVIDAAGGVEQAHRRLHKAMDEVQQVWSLGVDLGEGTGVMDFSTEAAWYSVEELLIWARTLDDRLRRKAVKRNYRKDQGLIPALADSPRRDAIVDARARLLQGGVDEARHLSGLNLHMQSSQAGSKHGRVRSGQIILRFPDRVTAPIDHRWELTYTQGRDAVSFADNLMVAVERFMDEMIEAFERHIPERFKSL